MGGISIFLSDYPAIIGLVHDKGFAKHFKIMNYLLGVLSERFSEWVSLYEL